MYTLVRAHLQHVHVSVMNKVVIYYLQLDVNIFTAEYKIYPTSHDTL
jgi:hypothetical protein